MPLFGAIRGTVGLAGIVTSGQYDAEFCISTAWGPQKEFLDGHRRLAEGVFETTYSNGQRVAVNYSDKPHPLGESGVVPPLGYRLLER